MKRKLKCYVENEIEYHTSETDEHQLNKEQLKEIEKLDKAKHKYQLKIERLNRLQNKIRLEKKL